LRKMRNFKYLYRCSIHRSVDRAYTPYMAGDIGFTRALIRRAENTELSLVSLEAIAEIRERLHELEAEAIKSARDKGATVDDIAEAIGLTPQAIYHRLRNGGQSARPGRPRSVPAQSTQDRPPARQPSSR
jgi:1,6-anhydro-N-acetylmuramate kinase